MADLKYFLTCARLLARDPITGPLVDRATGWDNFKLLSEAGSITTAAGDSGLP